MASRCNDQPRERTQSELAPATKSWDNNGVASLHEFEVLLNSASEGEKALILKWAVEELSGTFPGIDSRPEVCGGEPYIVRTRIPVWILEQARRLGASEQAVLANYPTLRAEYLQNAWAYARVHAGEIDSQIRENEAA